MLNSPRLYGQYKKAPGRKYRVLVGEASRQRRLSSLKLDTLVVVKVNVSVMERAVTLYDGKSKRKNPDDSEILVCEECGSTNVAICLLYTSRCV